MLFDRVYRLLVGKKGQTQGLEITELRIQFEIEKNAKKNPNKNTIKIYNLKRETREELEKPDTRCVLYAGYKEDQGPLLIFNGNVTFAYSKFEPPDIITELELGDGAKEIRDTNVSVGYGKKVKSGQVLKDVSNQMGMPLTLPSNAPERVWNNGISYYGSATGLLDKVTKGTGLEWSIQNNTVQVIEKGMVTTRTGILLSPDSGLLKYPERERKDKNESSEPGKAGKPGTSSSNVASDSESDEFSISARATETPTKVAKKSKKGKGGKKTSDPSKQVDGWKITTLLMPTLNPGDRVKLESRTVSGIFRVQEIKHSGDSHDGDWQSEIKLIDSKKPLADNTASKGGQSSAKPKEKFIDSGKWS